MHRYRCNSIFPNRLRTVLRHLCSQNKMGSRDGESTAGIIVIGDEILKGQTLDTNSHFLCKHLFSLGVKVKRISVIADDLPTIAEEVSLFSDRYTHVITTGGVGPTHDDVTYEGIAKAFNEPIIPHPEIVDLCEKYWGTADLTSAKLKVAFIPKSAVLLYGITETGIKTKFPIVSVRNVFVFPGIPYLLEKTFLLLKDRFYNPNQEFLMKKIYLSTDEVSIADALNVIDAKYKQTVTLGSYPKYHHSYYRVKLTLQSENANLLEEAYNALISMLPEGSIVDFEQHPVDRSVEQVYDLVQSSDSSEYAEKVRHAVSIIEESVEKYRLQDICISFNGGKDCTVLLHLWHAVVRKKFPEYDGHLPTLYIRSKDPFPEVEKFVQLCRDRYSLEMLQFNGNIKLCLSTLHDQHPEIKAIIMGTRDTDPFSDHLQPFSMTDHDWPQFMRVSPILSWNYQDIWHFLRSLSLPYCNLYDHGYTSLGSMNNTHPNPSLQYTDEQGIVRYRSAYKLTEDSKERDGRNK